MKEAIKKNKKIQNVIEMARFQNYKHNHKKGKPCLHGPFNR
jgi:hypothetical protein